MAAIQRHPLPSTVAGMVNDVFLHAAQKTGVGNESRRPFSQSICIFDFDFHASSIVLFVIYASLHELICSIG